MTKLFDTRFTLLQKSLDFRSRRNALLGSNIANLETPGYKAKDLVFEKALGQAMRAKPPGPLRVTHPFHMDGRKTPQLQMVEPKVITSENPNSSLDKNSVSLEKEMAKLAENQLTYQTLTQLISFKFRTLKTAIKEGQG